MILEVLDFLNQKSLIRACPYELARMGPARMSLPVWGLPVWGLPVRVLKSDSSLVLARPG